MDDEDPPLRVREIEKKSNAWKGGRQNPDQKWKDTSFQDLNEGSNRTSGGGQNFDRSKEGKWTEGRGIEW